MQSLPWLSAEDPLQPFPSAHRALPEPNGLLAAGGDLSAARLLRAYGEGIFPWFNPGEPILWWSPDPRAIIEPARFHCSRSLARRERRGDFALTLDTAFDAVLQACAAPRAAHHGTWLGAAMRSAYAELFRIGICHSLEVWRNGELAGGVYGLALGRCFFGESMFSRIDDGSKLALHALCRQLEAWEYPLFDCQVASPHLLRLGATLLPRAHFLARLRAAVALPGRSGRWSFDLPMPGDPRHLPRDGATA